MSLAHEVEALLIKLGSSGGKLQIASVNEAPSSHALALSWTELDAVLPDGGLPRGVVELSAPRALGGSTSVALAAVRAGQGRSKSAWCAWLDPEGTLHAPGVVAAGVDLARMLVVRGPRAQLGRVAVKMVESGAFEVVVIDFDAVPGAERASFEPEGATARLRKGGAEASPGGGCISVETERGRRRGEEPYSRTATNGGIAKGSAEIHRPPSRGHLLARKLALAAEPSGSTVLLLTNASRPHSIPWPVALRVELSRPGPCDLVVRVAKDKRARIGLAKTIPFRPPGFVFEGSAASALSSR